MIYVGPDARSPLDILAADSRVRVSVTGSWLDAEAGDES